jgi:hypothetical protein
MNEMDKREQLLRQDGYFLGIATLSLLNGMDFSPYFEPGMVLMRPLLFSFSISSPVLIFYFTSLFLALASVVIAGVPAAIYERMTGQRASDSTSLLIWLIGVGVIALPSFLRLLKFI